jgi:hypothetical protein
VDLLHGIVLDTQITKLLRIVAVFSKETTKVPLRCLVLSILADGHVNVDTLLSEMER